MSQDESSLGRKIDKKTLGDDSDEDESDDSSQSLNTQPRRRNPDQASVGILPLKEGTKKSKDNARHYHSKSESENGIESHLEDSKVARRAKGDLTKKSNWKGETNMRETEDIMSEDESSLGRKVGKKTLDDSNEDESDDFSQSLNTKPRRRNPDQYSIGILPLKEGTKKFKDDARHYHSESESENGIESHLEDSKVTRKAKGDLRKKSLLKGETKMTDDLSDDEEHHDFKKETKLSSLEDDGHRNYESCPKPAKTPRHHDEEGKKRGLNLELQERKITAPSSNQQTNNNVQVSDESGSDSSENNLRVRSHVQKKSDVVKKGNSNMLHQHVGSESDSDNLSGRILERQVEERALKKGSFKRSTKKNSHNKGGSDSESEQYCESEEKNKLSKKDTRDCRKMNQERYTSKKNSHNESESESDSESEQHYKSNGRKELSRKDTRDYGKMKEENNTSKRNLKKMSKYEEQNKSDSSEDKWTEKRPHSKISPKAKETHYSEVKTLSHLSDRSQSGRGREAKNHSSSRKVNAQSCSESDSDSDNYRVKEAKDPREARHGSAEKSMRKGISKEKKEYRKHEHESQSELSDGSYTDKEYSKGESYMGYGSRRGKNRSSHNDIESDPNEEQQGFHTPRAKSKHQQKGDVSKPYGRNFQEKMESIDRNLPRRQKSDAYSSLAEKERDAEDFTSKHSREKYRERNGGKSTYQQTGSESETEDQSFRNTSRGRVERPYKEDGEWTNSDSFKHKKRAHGKYKDPNSENQHLKNMNEGKREDTGQNVDYENDGAGYSPQRNFQRREDRYEERWSQEYHHKHGRGKEPKGNQFQMAERRVYRRQPGFNYDNAKDDRKEDYRRKKWDVCISDEEDVSENEPSLRHQPDRPGHLFQYRNLAKQRGSDENARPRISNIRGRPVRFSSDDEEEYVPPRTPRKQKTDQNPPNLYDDNRRGGQKSPDVNQGFCRRRNYSLRDRHDDFSFPKDLPRQRNLFPREAPVYQKPQRIQRRVRGPQSMSDISMREDPRNHNVQAHDFPSDEDDDYAGYEEIRGQKHKFSGPRREHPDNPRLVKGHWNNSGASTPGSEDYSDESVDERHVTHIGPEPVVHQRIALTPGKLISVLAKKRGLRATLLQLLECHHMKTNLVRRVVMANPHLFKMAGEMVEIRLNIKICNAHNGTRGCLNRSTCKDMHICSKYVRGKCDSEECVMGHYWLTRHNMGILSQLKIQNLSEGSLEKLLQSSFSNTGASKSEPSVCYKYNKGECQRQQCQQLHICYTYITNNLKCTKKKCKLNHSLMKLNCRRVLEAADIDVNESPKDVLAALLEANPALEVRDEGTKIKAGQDQGKGTTDQNDQGQGNGRQDHSNKTEGDAENKFNKKKKIRTFWSTQAYGEVNIAEICYNSVESTCPNETSGCQRLHALEHYHWQMSENGSNWLNLQMHQVKALERAYCDVSNDNIEMPRVDPSQQVSLLKKLGRDAWTADFKTMKIVNSSKTISFQIRRLCTETVPGKAIDAAVNVWYFLDKQQNWVEYGQVDSVGETNLVVSLASDAIEKEFLKDSSASIQFQNSKFTYTLDFKVMLQTNTHTQVTREVRRRPQIHLQEEKGQEQKQRKLPAHWDDMKSNERIKRVVIASSSDEYKNILPLLGNTSGNVTKIERVQNRFHWQAFQNKTEEMADIYGDPTKVNIRQLFHGTGHDIVPKICNENFDPKLHGQSAGQAYGQGTYFARDASLSFGYCKADSSGLKYMFVAKVAVGSLTLGNSSMARPPINSSTGYPFDSTGDNATNPSIIVKYDKAEYFPEYILTLK
ncbi:uncharacterized protein [Macrobrachium rosenbergii]|uniref:uncharacterized protein isoform X7 n=1 Tax=Macrobrachium rosenbergii TaxID=79674 RepID=UPI0034D6FD7F